MSTDKWIHEINEVTALFKNEFGHLTAEQLNWKPDGKTWSVAQNIDHLMVINATYYPVIKQIREKSYTLPWLSKFGFLVSFFGKVILKSVQPDRKRKMKTFPIWEPTTSAITADIIQRFEKHQTELKKVINGCSDLLDAGAIISSPANKKIFYTLAAAFDIITTHEKRHFEQAKEIYRIQSI